MFQPINQRVGYNQLLKFLQLFTAHDHTPQGIRSSVQRTRIATRQQPHTHDTLGNTWVAATRVPVAGTSAGAPPAEEPRREEEEEDDDDGPKLEDM